jgi:hypothetical protein
MAEAPPTPEEFVPLAEELGLSRYTISREGRVKNKTGYVMEPKPTADGHISLVMSTDDGKKTRKKVTRLMARTFMEPDADKPYIVHIDGNKANNRLVNLQRTNHAECKAHHKTLKPPAKPRAGCQIEQLTREGEFIRVWNSVAEASRALGINNGNLAACSRGVVPVAGGCRWRRHIIVLEGEEWRDLTVNDRTIRVSSMGRVENLRSHVGYGNPTTKGYMQIGLAYTMHLVHILVGRAFLPNPLGLPTIDHIDQDGTNNAVPNLRWATMQTQIVHSYECGKVSTPHKRSVVQKELAGDLVETYDSVTSAAATTGIDHATIVNCCRGNRKTAGGYRWEYASQ